MAAWSKGSILCVWCWRSHPGPRIHQADTTTELHYHRVKPLSYTTTELHLQPGPFPNLFSLLLMCATSPFYYISQASPEPMNLLPEPPKSCVVTGMCHHPILLLKEKLRHRVFLELCTRHDRPNVTMPCNKCLSSTRFAVS